MKKIIFVLSLLLSIPVFAAQPEEAKHSCQSSDLVGLWQTAGYKETPPGALTANFKDFPYEYLIFDSYGNFAYDGRQKAADVNFKTKEDLTNFIRDLSTRSRLAGKFNYTVDGGILSILRDDKSWQKFECFIVDADMPNGMKKDDMLWAAPATKSTPSVMRIERRIIKN